MADLVPRVLLLFGGVGALYFGAEWLIYGSARLATRFGLSPIVIGLTVVSLGTSAPEMAVSMLAAVRGSSDIAVGNVLGSNLANIGLVLGLTALVRPLNVAARIVIREIPIMLVITLLLFPLMADLTVSRGDGLILLALLVGYLVFVFRVSGDEPPAVVGEFEQFVEGDKGVENPASVVRDLALVATGVTGLVVGGYAIIEGATYVAQMFGIPDLIVGLTLVAVGTSLPELATTVVAALRGEADIAVGNVVGSNIFNMTAVLGGSALLQPISVVPHVLRAELPAVMILSLIVFPVARSRLQVARWEGGILVAAYIALAVWLFI